MNVKVNYNSEVSKKRKDSGYNGRRSIGRRNRRNEKNGERTIVTKGLFCRATAPRSPSTQGAKN